MTERGAEDRAALENSARSGQPDKQFELACHLLAHPQKPQDWVDAAALFESAAAAGFPDAIERCALLEAIGMGRSADWNRAFDRLADAANRGSARATGALATLSDQEIGGGDMQSRRRSLDPSRILRAPSHQELSINPLIRTYEGFATARECQWLIDSARSRLAPAQVADPRTNRLGPDPARSNTSAAFTFADLDLVMEAIRARISNAVGIPLAAFEAPQILHYEVGQEFRPHVDYLEPSSPLFAEELARRGQRAATFLLYLNDDFGGGETAFPRLDIRYRGQTGDAILFANVGPMGNPDPRTVHAGEAPTHGQKWILSQWIRDSAQR
nr:2OG-Fe(II) oxygenase [uncultured Sphingomonas sp.]